MFLLRSFSAASLLCVIPFSPVYDPTFVLSADRKRYVATNTNTPATLPAPGLPFSLVFRAEPGAEHRILKVASAYEALSKRRVPPPAYPELRTRN